MATNEYGGRSDKAAEVDKAFERETWQAEQVNLDRDFALRERFGLCGPSLAVFARLLKQFSRSFLASSRLPRRSSSGQEKGRDSPKTNDEIARSDRADHQIELRAASAQ
jgi:hypothetical protein